MSTLSVQNIDGVISLGTSNLSIPGIMSAGSYVANSKPSFGVETLVEPVYFNTSAASVSITNIPTGYHELIIQVAGLRHDAPNNAYMILETSNNNGSTWHTSADRVSDSTANGNMISNRITMLNANGDLGGGCFLYSYYGGWYSRYGTVRNQIAPTNAMRLTMNAGNIVSCNIGITGIKI